MTLNSKFKKMKKIIKQHNNIFIMGHIDLDLDAIGACIGLSKIAKSFHKKSYIINNDKVHEAGVKKILSGYKNEFNFISGKQARQLVSENDLLIVVDVNKYSLVQDSEFLEYFKDVIVIDHHEKSEASIAPSFELIDINCSSTCELITKFIYYFGIDISSKVATILLAGIYLDTNSYSIKTSNTTYLSSFYLTECGASVNEVQYLLKQDIDDYILRQRVITDVEVINKKIAIANGSQKIKYRREDLAKIADTLLQFNHIEASFVIGKLNDDVIGISGRSMGKVNVSAILEKLGGGGNKNEAAARIEGKTIKEVDALLRDIL